MGKEITFPRIDYNEIERMRAIHIPGPFIIYDEWASSSPHGGPAWERDNNDIFADAMTSVGFAKRHFQRMSEAGAKRFKTYAEKRGASNHPHNVKWKKLWETYIALCVARKLESL